MRILCSFIKYECRYLIRDLLFKSYPIKNIDFYSCNDDCIFIYSLNHDVIYNLSNTINLHYWQDSNTYYTINALNIIICKMNNGLFKKNYLIDWELYTNQLIVHDTESNDTIIKDMNLIEKFYRKN